jgi:hypothetical protein
MTQTKQTTDAIRSEQKVSLENRVLRDDELEVVAGGMDVQGQAEAIKQKAQQSALESQQLNLER